MKELRKTLIIATIAIVTLAMAALVSLVSLNQSAVKVNAAPAQAPAAQATTAPATSSQTPDKYQALVDGFSKSFAAKAGVDEAKLNSAFSGAVSETADEAVKNGTLNQAQADFIKAQSKNGFKGLLATPKFDFSKAPKGKGDWKGTNEALQYLLPILNSVSQSLKLSPIELAQQIQSGKSLADVAKAQGVELQTVKDATTAAIKTQLDGVVKAGKVTQAQADKALQTVNIWFDEVANLNVKNLPNGGNFDQKEAETYFTPVLNATAQVLGLTPDQLKSQVQSGKTLGEIAKAQGVELAKVKSVILDSGKAQLDALVKAGKVTQSQADKAYQTVVLWFDELVK